MSNFFKLFSFLRKSGKSVKGAIDKSSEFIEETLESEYVTGAIEKAKEATGDVAQKAGELYERTKIGAENLVESDVVQNLKDKGLDLVDKVKENEIVQDITDKAKDLADTIGEKGKELVDQARSNEHVQDAMESVKETAQSAKDKFEEFTSEEE